MLSAFEEELRDFWSPELELLAQIVETLDVIRYGYYKAHGAKGVPKPRSVPRPKTMLSSPGPRVLSMRDYITEFGEDKAQVIDLG